MSADIRPAKGKGTRRGLWVVETRERARYPRFGNRKVARWGKWSAWRPHIWCDRGGRSLTRHDAQEFLNHMPSLYTEQFRIARYTP